jgi:hypothetical protein
MNKFGKAGKFSKPDKFGHVTRYSDSSLYDEVCVLCGGTDGIEDRTLQRLCVNIKEWKENGDEQRI